MGGDEAGRVSPEVLGPRGIEERIAEIHAKMASVFGSDSSAPQFSQVLSGAIGAPQVATGADSGITIKADPQLISMAGDAARRNGLDPNLFASLIDQESGFQSDARSPKGAVGLSQLMPQTAADLGVTDRYDPAQSLEGGAKYLSQLMSRYGGDPTLALAAYNAGPAAVDKYRGVPPFKETQNYVQQVMAKANRRANG